MENDYRITKLHGTFIGDNRIPDLPDGETVKILSSANGKTAWVDLPTDDLPTDVGKDASGFAVLCHDGVEIAGQKKSVKLADVRENGAIIGRDDQLTSAPLASELITRRYASNEYGKLASGSNNEWASKNTFKEEVTLAKEIAEGQEITPVKINLKNSSYDSENPSYIGGDGLSVEIGTKSSSSSTVFSKYKFYPDEMRIPGALMNSNEDYISLLYQNCYDSCKKFESYNDLLQYVKDSGGTTDNGGIFIFCRYTNWDSGQYNYRVTFYFLGQMAYNPNSNEHLSFSGWWKGTPSLSDFTGLYDNWHPYSGSIPRSFTYESTLKNYMSEYSNNWDIHAYFSEEGDYYLNVTRAFETGMSNTLRYNNITPKKLPNKYHTITIKDGQKILFTTTMPSTMNTPVDSYDDLKTLFGGELLVGYGEYCQLDLRGGTEATDKLIKADGTEVTLASLGAIVYTDVCFLPK